MASKEAFEMAQVTDDYLLANEVGCIFGNDSSSTPVIEAAAIYERETRLYTVGFGLYFSVNELYRDHEP